jgi:hypothetical protein
VPIPSFRITRRIEAAPSEFGQTTMAPRSVRAANPSAQSGTVSTKNAANENAVA